MTKKRKAVAAAAGLLLVTAGVMAVSYDTIYDRIHKHRQHQRNFADGMKATPVSYKESEVAKFAAPSTLSIGPDKRLYAGSAFAGIMRYDLDSKGHAPNQGTPIGDFAGKRMVLGIAFDPRSTADSPMLWVAHTQMVLKDAEPFTGMLSLLQGPNLSERRDVITGLPRSTWDHANNGIAFGPDGLLYMTQGSNTGYGLPDRILANRNETSMTASLLVADVQRDARFSTTVNVDTSKGYDPFAADAPVKIFATGMRNPYDLVWHSNGRLYVPVNESSQGNTPPIPGNPGTALKDLPAGNDFLADATHGGYFGHPNPVRNEYVLNGGNPTAGPDPWEVREYPVGIEPEPTFKPRLHDFGIHRSADGIAEFRSDRWGPALQHSLLVTEFSIGQGIEVLPVLPDGTTGPPTRLSGDLAGPLDVTVDADAGRIYIAEYGETEDGTGGKITLLQLQS